MTNTRSLFHSVFYGVLAAHFCLLFFCVMSPFVKSEKNITGKRPKPKLAVQTVSLSPAIEARKEADNNNQKLIKPEVKNIEMQSKHQAPPPALKPEPLQSKQVALPAKASPLETKAITPAVKTLEAKPQPTVVKQASKQPPKKMAKQAPPVKTPPQKVSSSASNAQSENSQAQEANRKAASFNQQKQALFKKAQESINQIQAQPKQTAVQATSQPKSVAIGMLQSEITIKGSDWGNLSEINYHDLLINRLKDHLKMPDFGNVEIKLTISRSGQFVSMIITKEENRSNRIYIEKMMPNLAFPPFGNFFSGESQHTFHLTLSNDL